MGSRNCLLLSAAAVLATSPAAAQESAADNARDGTIEEITVTAERFESTVQRTPVSVEVYSGDELAERGVTSIRDLTRIEPSVNFFSAAGHDALAVRGISTSNGTETGEPAVSVAIDGAFNNRGYSLRANLYDIERVEILRGPQGTLFGRNTTGGLLNVITARPRDEFSGQVTLDIGDYQRKNVEGYVNVPITGTLAARAAFSVRDRKGYRNNDFGQHSNDDQTASARLQLQWEPTEALRLWGSASFTRETGLGDLAETIPFRYAPGTPLLPDGRPVTAGTEPLHDIPPSISNGVDYLLHTRGGQEIETKDFKFSAAYEFGGGIELSYLGAYNEIDFYRPSPFEFRGTPAVFTRREFPRTWNHEVRLSSAPGGRLIWQIGGQIFDEKSSLNTDLVRNPGSETETQLYQFLTPKVRQKSKAVFGQASFELIDGLKLTGGLRYTDDKKSREGNFFIRRAFTGAPVDVVVTQNGGSASDKVTWLVGLDYQVSDDSFLYAKVSTGYKAGGFTGISQYAPETVRAYEIGSKNKLLDGNLQLNISGYYMDYLDQQVNQYLSVNGSPPQAVTTNAGKSRIYGVETSIIAALGELGRLSGSVNYTHARYVRFNFGAGWSAPPASVTVLDLKGNHLPAAPDWAIAADWEKSFDTSWDGQVTMRLNGKYQSTVYFAPTNFDNQRQDGYVLFNAAVGFQPDNDRWGVEFYVDNIGNKKYFAFADEVYPLAAYSFSYGPPRMFGARITGKF